MENSDYRFRSQEGTTNYVSNYRTISLTSVVSKLMERVIFDQLNFYFYSNHIISPHQFGFRRNISTAHQLINSHYDWVIQQNEGCPSDVILLDYSKAFDSVVYTKLFIKLSAYGIHGASLLWFENFLTDKKHFLLTDSAVSDYCSVLSCVPQGTVLGPVLFIIYVLTCHSSFKKRIKTELFTNYAKIYDEIESISDCLCMQESLNSVFNFFQFPIGLISGNLFLTFQNVLPFILEKIIHSLHIE